MKAETISYTNVAENHRFSSKIFLMILGFLLVLPSVFSAQTYSEIGNDDQAYTEGTGFWNQQTTGTSIATRSITTARHVPLVADLDNNGVNEIVQLDGTNYEVYQTKDLVLLNSFLSTNISGTAYFILFDIDADNFTEIISVDDGSGTLEIIEFNGTGFTLENSFSIGGTHDADGEVMLNCREAENCLVVYGEKNICAVGGDAQISMRFFNSTDLGLEERIENATGFGNDCISQCFAKIRHISVADYDTDGTDELIFSYIQFNAEAGSDEIYRIQYIDILSNKTPAIEQTVTIGSTPDFDTGLNSCDDGYGDFLTSPLVADLDGSTGNGLETILGFNIDADEFNMEAFDRLGSSIDVFPFLQDADGKLISNVIKMEDNEGFDFCVVGYQDTLLRMDVLCGSLTDTVGIFDNIEYRFDNVPYNVTQTYDFMNTITHSVVMSSLDTPNTDELINTFGVFNLDFDSCSIITGFCNIDLIFDISDVFGKEDGAVIPVDPEQDDRNDLLMLTSTNLFYFDDGFSNTPANISQIFTNPCLDSTWKVNTTVNLQLTCSDVDEDNVNGNVTLYQGTSNEQTQQSANVSTGTTLTFSFTANQTIGSSSIVFECRDVENPNFPDTEILSFSVAEQGVEFNDCTTLLDFEAITGVPTTIGSTGISTNNSLTNAVTIVSDQFGFNTALVWLILMALIAGGMFFGGIESKVSSSGTIGLVLLVQVLMLIIGTLLGFLNIGILLTIIILGIIAISFWFRRQFTSGSVS